jgi:hypothetical protein
MRALPLIFIVTLSLCTGCSAPGDWHPNSPQTMNCVSGTRQASLTPVPCSPLAWPPPGTVFTHPNGDGPQVELWGPPSGGGAGGPG